jgi:RNA polymerase sigma-70 factor (ECF subfamily)
MLANTEESEEVVQETFIKVLQNLEKFRKDSSFAAWMFRIAHNSCIDILRARQRKGKSRDMAFDPQSTHSEDDAVELHLSVVSQIPDSEPGPAQNVDRAEEREVISQSLRQLPESQRAVLVLHDIEGFSYQEIADIVGANVGTVRSRLHYGRLKLRELLSPYFQNAMASYPR